MWAEDEVYQKWLVTPEGERGDVRAQLAGAVGRHAQAVVWKRLGENHPGLVQDIVADVMIGLRNFRGDHNSKFSTWVHAVAENKVYEEIRRRKRYRAVFDETVAVVGNPHEDEGEEPDNRVREVAPSINPDLEGPIAFAEFAGSLSDADAVLLQHKRAGLSSREAAERMGITVEAVDSRWARLKPKLGEEFRPVRRK
jgi:RNA polymerase sigma factor (sigma-70 family)